MKRFFECQIGSRHLINIPVKDKRNTCFNGLHLQKISPKKTGQEFEPRSVQLSGSQRVSTCAPLQFLLPAP